MAKDALPVEPKSTEQFFDEMRRAVSDPHAPARIATGGNQVIGNLYELTHVGVDALGRLWTERRNNETGAHELVQVVGPVSDSSGPVLGKNGAGPDRVIATSQTGQAVIVDCDGALWQIDPARGSCRRVRIDQ